MIVDYWELLTKEEEVIRDLAIWVINHADLVDLVEFNADWLQLRIIPSEIIPMFQKYSGFLEAWEKSKHPYTKVTGYYKSQKYSLKLHDNMIEAIFNGLSPIIIDLDARKLSIKVTDGATGESTLVAGLSPINYSKILSDPGVFPKFVRIGWIFT